MCKRASDAVPQSGMVLNNNLRVKVVFINYRWSQLSVKPVQMCFWFLCFIYRYTVCAAKNYKLPKKKKKLYSMFTVPCIFTLTMVYASVVNVLEAGKIFTFWHWCGPYCDCEQCQTSSKTVALLSSSYTPRLEMHQKGSGHKPWLVRACIPYCGKGFPTVHHWKCWLKYLMFLFTNRVIMDLWSAWIWS